MEKYFYSLMKCDASNAGSIAGLNDVPYYSNYKKQLLYNSENDFSEHASNWEVGIVNDRVNNSYELFDNNVYGSVLILSNQEVKVLDKLFVKAKLKRLNFSEQASNKALFTASVKDLNTGKISQYIATPLNPLPYNDVNKWRTIAFEFNLNIHSKENFEIRIGIWNKEKQKFAIDDYQIEIYGKQH